MENLKIPKNKGKLAEPPLKFTLVQVCFSPVAAMENYVLEIQDRLRKTNFPGYKRETVQNWTLSGEQPPQSKTLSRWIFLSKDETQGIVLTQDFFVFQTTEYRQFSEFSQQVSDVVSVLKDIAEIEFSTRIGLRYVNILTEIGSEPPENSLHPRLRGTSWDLFSSHEVDVQNFSFSVITTDIGKLQVRVADGEGEKYMPPDLANTGLKFQFKINPGDQYRIFDLDHISQNRIGFEAEEITGTMNALHSWIDSVFWALTTNEAHAFWNASGA